MNISAIPAFNVNNAQAFKAHNSEPKPVVKVTDDMADNEVVGYGTWGPNYVYPITAGQVRHEMQEAKKAAAEAAKQQARQEAAGKAYKETPEEYMKRKLYSTEWCS